jgi:hypothetical protein
LILKNKTKKSISNCFDSVRVNYVLAFQRLTICYFGTNESTWWSIEKDFSKIRTATRVEPVAELEPVRQSGSGPAGPDKTGRKVHPVGRNRIFAGFRPDKF